MNYKTVTVGKHAAEMLSSSFSSCLPDPVGAVSFLVAVGEPAIDDFFEIANANPDTLVGRFLDSERDLIFEGVKGRFDNSNVVAIWVKNFLLSYT